MSRNNNGFPPQDNRRRGPDYGPYHNLRQDGGTNRMASLFPPYTALGGSLDPREGEHYEWRLLRERVPGSPVIMNSFPVSPYLSNQNQFSDNGATRIQIARRHAADPVPYGQWNVQAPEEESKLTRNEQKRVLEKLKKQIYNPTPKWLKRRPSLYYRDNPIHSPRETDNDKDDDGKRCPICLEDFEPKEVVTVTPCNHMYHEECIVPWVKSQGQCPVCRFTIHDKYIESSPPSRNIVADDQFGSEGMAFETEVMAMGRAMEQAILSETMRRMN